MSEGEVLRGRNVSKRGRSQVMGADGSRMRTDRKVLQLQVPILLNLGLGCQGISHVWVQHNCIFVHIAIHDLY